MKQEEDNNAPARVSFMKLFRFSTRREKLFIIVGSAAAIVVGLTLPSFMIMFSKLTDAFVNYQLQKIDKTKNSTMTSEEFMHEISKFGIACTFLGLSIFLLDYIFVACLNYAAESQILRIRDLFFKSILRQDIGWYDTHQTGDFASRVTEDLCKMQDGIGEKVGMFIYLAISFIVNLTIAFVYGWKLTLVVLCATPILVISTAIVSKVQTSLTERELQAYAKSGSIAEEVLSAIRTVVAFEGQDKEVERYNKNLEEAKKTGMKRGLISGIGGGVMWFITYASYSLAFWYGVTLILEERGTEDPEYTPGVLAIIFFGVLTGALNIGQASPYMEAFSTARASAATIFSVIDRIPQIDNLSDEGETLKSVTGTITFEDIDFDYPSRPDVKILQGLDITVNKGQTVALVGSSGCGKSTCIQLIQRFYDPLQGSIKLDGIDIRKLKLSWLRSQIGVVGQEPVLFGTTIAENIRYGKSDATKEEIERAAKEANAHGFIMRLPQKYDTMVGERGAQLSGGQKQRIAIARALVRKPAILLLDEATSALDTNSEAIVQSALNKASQGRTTIVVAHRLSTIRSADNIIVLSKGNMVEQGTHEELMDLQGHYYDLIMAQVKAEDDLDESQGNEEGGEDIPKRESANRRLRSASSTESEKEFRHRLTKDKIQPQLEDIKEDEEEYNVSFNRIMSMNTKEWYCILIGCIGSAVVGFSTPLFAVVFGEIYGVLSLEKPEDVRSETDNYSIVFLFIGITAGIATFLQTYMFNIAGVKLTMRLRTITFRTMLKQEIGWFDDEKNSTGALCARLSGDAASVQGATGTRIGATLQCFATMLLGILLSLYYEWKIALVTIVFVPLIIMATFFEGRLVHSQGLHEKEALEDATKIAVEAISNIRTVVSLGRETTFHQQYMKKLEKPHNQAARKIHLRGVIFGLGQSMPFFAYATALYYGGYLVAHENLHYKNVIKVTEALFFSTMMVGQALAFLPNFKDAKLAAGKIFKLIDRKPLISSSCEKKYIWDCEGDVSYSGVEFFYPNRPGANVLNGLDLEVNQGQMVALVGPSGCGKSTCIQLLERFYDPVAGTVKLDDYDITTKNLSTVRAQMGIVSQEPVLFDRTIAENIAYGDNSREVTMPEIIEAAKQSNIHEFISSLPLGYGTPLGEKGTQLSGGQKQRVAIARALVRNPKILLLDEATSALDTESEKVVQEALDKAKEGRTCITIAHRLSTIQDADVICVISQGKIVETGSHSELLATKGIYNQLHSLQSGQAKSESIVFVRKRT